MWLRMEQITIILKNQYSLNTSIKKNDTLCLIDYIKIEYNNDREKFIYIRYLQDNLIKILKYSKNKPITYERLDSCKFKINKADQIRIKNTDKQIEIMKKNIIEFIILDLLKRSIKCREKNDINWKLGIFSIKTILNYKLNNFNALLFRHARILIFFGKNFYFKKSKFEGIFFSEFSNRNLGTIL